LRLNNKIFTRKVGIKLSNEFGEPPLLCILPAKFLVFQVILFFRYFFGISSLLPENIQIGLSMICFTIIISGFFLFPYAKNRCNQRLPPLSFDTNASIEYKAPTDFLFISLKD